MSESFSAERERLNSLARSIGAKIPATMGAFSSLHKEALKDGALPKKIKELMALAISIKEHCRGCIAYHVHDALKAGATKEEVMETIGVAMMMGGGPSMVYSCEALEALEEFSK